MYTVIKRDGKITDFDLKKISNAISLAFDAQERDYNQDIIDFLALKVTAHFEPKIKEHHIAVEDIQDSVEAVLIQAGYEDVAKAYDTKEEQITIISYEIVNSIKITFPRKHISGSIADDDVYGCQQHIPLANIEI